MKKVTTEYFCDMCGRKVKDDGDRDMLFDVVFDTSSYSKTIEVCSSCWSKIDEYIKNICGETV
jgi:hypothetical protein